MKDDKILSEYFNNVIPNTNTHKYEIEQLELEIKTLENKLKILKAYLKDKKNIKM